MEFKPSFINVTYHRSETMFKKKADGKFEKVEVRKRPGTVGICAAIITEAEADLAFVQNAPHETPVSRVDEVRAARHPILRWTP